MPLDEDKYPPETGRRRFVTGVVGSAALAGIGVGGAAAIDTITDPSGEGGGTTEFVGVENIDGPAPRAMPIVPIEIQDGRLTGVWPEFDPDARVALASDFGGAASTTPRRGSSTAVSRRRPGFGHRPTRTTSSGTAREPTSGKATSSRAHR